MRSSAIAFSLALAIALPAAAGQVLLTPASVVGDTGSYNYNNTGHPGAFDAGRVFDDQTGPIGAEVFTQGYWINGDNGPVDAFITVDLGAARTGLSFDLFNTSNGGANDRGTGNFTLVGANAVVADGANGATLAGPISTLVTGTLASEAGTGPRTAQGFTAVDLGAFRYVQFRPHSVASAQTICCSYVNNYGLNELRVFSSDVAGSVPEPSSWAILICGLFLTGTALRRRSTTLTASAI